MGFEMACQALPAGCGLLERARADQALGEILCLVPHWLRTGGPRRGRWPDADELWGILTELVRRHPGLDRRNCSLDRRWDRLHYLLSANRRDEPGTQADAFVDRAFRAGDLIADHVRAGQGVPVRHVPPADVVAIAAVLELMSGETLRQHYNPQKMEASGVYKFWADRADERQWGYLCEDFAAFRRFYLAAAEHGEGVFVCLD